jgi:hypothetical protein
MWLQGEPREAGSLLPAVRREGKGQNVESEAGVWEQDDHPLCCGW